MSDRDIHLLLQDIKTAVCSILEYTVSYNSEAYEGDIKTRNAVERNFEIIGEAASRIPNNYKDLHLQLSGG